MKPHKKRSRVYYQTGSNGLAEINEAYPITARCRYAGTNQRTIYGLAMVSFSMFKFSVNQLLGVTPDPMNASITFFLGCVGFALIASGQLGER